MNRIQTNAFKSICFQITKDITSRTEVKDEEKEEKTNHVDTNIRMKINKHAVATITVLSIAIRKHRILR